MSYTRQIRQIVLLASEDVVFRTLLRRNALGAARDRRRPHPAGPAGELARRGRREDAGELRSSAVPPLRCMCFFRGLRRRLILRPKRPGRGEPSETYGVRGRLSAPVGGKGGGD